MSVNDNEQNQQENRYLTTQEVADYLGKSIPTIYKYMKEKKIEPIYDHKWRMRKTKLFDRSEIEEFKQKITKPGKTTFKVAEELDIPYHTLMKFIHEGILPAKKKNFQGKEQYFIDDHDLNSFIVSPHWKRYIEKREKDILSSQDEYLLFQSFYNPITEIYGRLMETGPAANIITSSNGIISLEAALNEGFKPKMDISKMKYINRKGYAKFKFIKPFDIQSSVYKIIEKFYQSIGTSNMKMEMDHNHIFLEVKPSLFRVFDVDEIELLKQSVLEGEIIEDAEGIYVDTDLEPLTIYLPSRIKESIRQIALEQDHSMEELVINVLKEKWDL
jgi:excisionase family DNA binding protein